MNPDDLLVGLNDQQTKAVTAPLAPTLVIAGPGSGKTAVLTRRVAYLIAHYNVAPYQIMAVTFTNKAAGEMRERVAQLLGKSARELSMSIGTFHAICAQILRRESTQIGLSRDFLIYDTDDQINIVKQALTAFGIDTEKSMARRYLNLISNAKNELKAPAELNDRDFQEKSVSKVYARYQDLLRAANALDFDDLLMQTVALFRAHADTLTAYQERYQHLLVDEFQDTNTAQYELVRLLAGPRGSLFCVGDPDQSIYRFRGADYRNLGYFQRDYPKHNLILLEHNYRSHQIILDAAMAVINKNTDRIMKQLKAARRDGPKIQLRELTNEEDEAQYVVWKVREYGRSGAYQFRDCAVMFRTNAQSRGLEETFVRAGVPYRLVGGVRFYSRKEVKDLLAYLRVIQNPQDTVSLLRIINTPARGIGKATVDKLGDWAATRNQSAYDALMAIRAGETSPITGRPAKLLTEFTDMIEKWRALRETTPIGELLKSILEETQYTAYLNDGTPEGKERVESVRELLRVANDKGAMTLAMYLEEIALVSDVDSLNDDADGAVLLTLHAAKGLEFPVVFIVGMEEGLLPHQNAADDPEQMAEERRLMYVGLTRAKEIVHLTWAARRSQYGGMGERTLVSRFVVDLPPELTTGTPVPRRSAGDARIDARTDPRTQWRPAASSESAPSRPAWRPTPPPITPTPAPRPKLPQANLNSFYKTGQRVRHERFGDGVIIASRLKDGDEELDIRFERVGFKRLYASMAPLTMLTEED